MKIPNVSKQASLTTVLILPGEVVKLPRVYSRLRNNSE